MSASATVAQIRAAHPDLPQEQCQRVDVGVHQVCLVLEVDGAFQELRGHVAQCAPPDGILPSDSRRNAGLLVSPMHQGCSTSAAGGCSVEMHSPPPSLSSALPSLLLQSFCFEEGCLCSPGGSFCDSISEAPKKNAGWWSIQNRTEHRLHRLSQARWSCLSHREPQAVCVNLRENAFNCSKACGQNRLLCVC